MKQLSVLIKPASSLCNLRCQYCFYANISDLRDVRSFGRMTSAVMEKMIDQIFLDLEDGDQLSVAFQGGEPTLAGLAYFQAFVAHVKQQSKNVTVRYAIQTNGTLINEAWCQFLAEEKFLVGLSLDGGAKFHNDYRVNPKGQGTFGDVMRTKTLFDRFEIDYNVLCVLTNQNARHPKQLFNFIISHQIDYMQFIPCLDDLDVEKPSIYALTPERFASFYKQLFFLWEQEYRQGNYYSINLFDNIANLLGHGQVNACGLVGQCAIQYVIEGDGSVYPCDFYALDDLCLGNITESTLRELFSAKVVQRFLRTPRDMSGLCETCPYAKLCGGGCKRMAQTIYKNSEGTYCGYQDLLNTVAEPLFQISRN
ncbi:SPASM domain-containing protein [Vagococcus sp. BWB3-3]|uniref:SPASM domain-containing protein n=1 Tax=Vagococcus allomyrinae TaxID=2794353 RepID=A0A940PCG5_9ENTE|nr:SPASM domain-containing protein [Vagococcus allomyrinae]MBP1041448.1 SPASM domain-containing protein [Vagococcus allomyrinae]